WSDDTPVTADDIVYTYEHVGDPAMGNQWIPFLFSIKGLADWATGKGPASAIGVKKVDDRTVTYEGQNGFVPYLPQLLAYQAAAFSPKHVVEKDPEHWADTAEGAISNGPYLCSKWDHGKSIEYVINPKYNGPFKPYLQVLRSSLVPAGGTAPNAFNQFLAQEIDLWHLIDAPSLAAARADPKLNPLVHFFPNFQSTYLNINVAMPPLDNHDFRQALAHAIDRDTLTQQVFGGTETTGYEMLPPGFPGYTDENKDAQIYDLDKAKASLAASGIDPKTVKLKLYSQNATRDKWMSFIQQQWRDNLGVDSEIIENQPTWGADRPAHTMQVDLGTYEYDFIDPSNLLSGLFHSIPAPEGKSEPWGSPRHAWKSDAFDALLDSADSETDVDKRIKMYQDAQKLLIDDVGVIFLAHQIVFQIWWPWLTGFLPNKQGNTIYNWLGDSMFHGYIRADVDELKAQYR
ncbi:MAG: peptide ABC transporter substrate-binding protein, partial [Anaerolineales bacterium]